MFSAAGRQCEPLLINNAEYDTSVVGYFEDEVEVSCSDGYELDGGFKVFQTVCQADGKWDSHPDICQRE